jgi:hypothetical protein
MPREIASSRDRFNGAETASPTGVLPLNCANNGNSVQNSVETALRRVKLCLTPSNIFDDCTRQRAVSDEGRAFPMHPLEQGASSIIDECNMLKIHQYFAGGVVRAGGSPAIFELWHVALGQAPVHFQRHAIADGTDLRPHHFTFRIARQMPIINYNSLGDAVLISRRWYFS